MADVTSIVVPAGPATNTTQATVSAGHQTFYPRMKFIFAADQDCNLTFYNSHGGTLAASSTVGYRVFAKSPVQFDLGPNDTIGYYNFGASTANISIQPISTD